MFGINGAEFFVILVVVALVVGPDGVIQALRTFKSLIAAARRWSATLREETRRDMGDVSLPNMDWSSFDLREYDPREMVRQAVREEMAEWMKTGSPSRPPSPPAHPVPGGDVPNPATSLPVSGDVPTPAAPVPGATPPAHSQEKQ